MAPKKGTKKAAGVQPTLSFQSRKPSVPSPSRKKALAAKTASSASVTNDTAVEPSTPPKRTRRSAQNRATTPTLVPASSDEEVSADEDEVDDFEIDRARQELDDDPFIVPSSATKIASASGTTAKPPVPPALVKTASMAPEAVVGSTKDKIAEKRALNVKSREVKALMKDARVAMGGMEPIHAGPNTHNDVHHILRVFDMTSAYGPCVGMSRLQRWERAKKWGLNPPEEIRNILTTVEGQKEVAYRENVLHEWV